MGGIKANLPINLCLKLAFTQLQVKWSIGIKGLQKFKFKAGYLFAGIHQFQGYINGF